MNKGEFAAVGGAEVAGVAEVDAGEKSVPYVAFEVLTA